MPKRKVIQDEVSEVTKVTEVTKPQKRTYNKKKTDMLDLKNNSIESNSIEVNPLEKEEQNNNDLVSEVIVEEEKQNNNDLVSEVIVEEEEEKQNNNNSYSESKVPISEVLISELEVPISEVLKEEVTEQNSNDLNKNIIEDFDNNIIEDFDNNIIIEDIENEIFENMDDNLILYSNEDLVKTVEFNNKYSIPNIYNNIIPINSLSSDLELEPINDFGINNIINNEIDNILENKYTLDDSEIQNILNYNSITPNKSEIDLSTVLTITDMNDNEITDMHDNNITDIQNNKIIDMHDNKITDMNDNKITDIQDYNNNITYTLDNLRNTFNKFNEAILLIQIIDGNIKFIEKKGYESRNQSVIDLLIKANNYNKLPDIQFLVYTNDFIDNNLLSKCPFLFTFCKKYSYCTQLFLNFSFNHWLEAGIDNYDLIYNHFTNNIIEWDDKKDTIFWSGYVSKILLS
jgi:hypothetical protein